MHIIFGDQLTEEISDKYIVLELDRFNITAKDQKVSAYCLIENVPLSELPQAHHFRDLHTQMIKNYRNGNWKFCQDALEHLHGRWNGEVDSFYTELLSRVTDLCNKQVDLANWDPAIKI